MTDESVAIDGFGEPYGMDRIVNKREKREEAACACMSVRSFATGPM